MYPTRDHLAGPRRGGRASDPNPRGFSFDSLFGLRNEGEIKELAEDEPQAPTPASIESARVAQLEIEAPKN